MHHVKQLVSFGIWIIFIFYGIWEIDRYSSSPGALASADPQWSNKSKIHRDLDKPTLLVFFHPQCPCSRASMSELEEMLPQIKDKIAVSIIFFKPKNKSDDWAKSSLWKKAVSVTGKLPQIDTGDIADSFGVKTSGQVLLYDKTGKLIFNGGITPQRGHVGNNLGKNMILNFVKNQSIPQPKSLVFGCSLKNPERKLAGVNK